MNTIHECLALELSLIQKIFEWNIPMTLLEHVELQPNIVQHLFITTLQPSGRGG